MLRSLPGHRAVWVVAWSSVWPLGSLILSRLSPGAASDLEGVVEGLTTMYGALIALWGTAKLARDAEGVGPVIDALTGGTAQLSRIFRGLGSAAGPITLTAALLMMWVGPAIGRQPFAIVILTSMVSFIAFLPLVVLAWTAGVVLLGLHRLGGRPLLLKPFEEDRSLGLRHIGSLAFTPFLIFVVSVLPGLLFAPLDLRDAALDIGFMLLGVVLLLASLWRLRRQMLAAKAVHTRWARGLYAQAVGGVRADPSVEGLRSHDREVLAAESMVRHASAVQEWPFEEGILRVMAAMLTSVISAILVRLILGRLGL